MNTLLSLILIALITVAIIGNVLIIALFVAAVKKHTQLRKETKVVLETRKRLEEAVVEVDALQHRVIDQAVTIAAKELTDYLESLSKD